MEQCAGCEMQRSSQRVLRIFAWRHDLFLCPLWHPGCPDLRQQVNIEFIRKEHDLLGLQVFVMKPTAGQTLKPLRVIYAGGGVGWYHTTLDYNAPSPFPDKTTQKFGVHAGGGVRVPIAPGLAFDMNGRYVWLQNQETAIVPREFNPDFWDMSLGLALHF